MDLRFFKTLPDTKKGVLFIHRFWGILDYSRSEKGEYSNGGDGTDARGYVYGEGHKDVMTAVSGFTIF